MLIPVEIENHEILVRFIFADDFKKSTLSKEKIKDGEVFIDTRGLGVSLQRAKYTTTRFCLDAGDSIKTKVFVGFIFFKKQSYIEACELMQKERPNFNSELKFSPLDESGEYLEKIDKIDSNDRGNPSHADIFYIEPQSMMKPDEQTPNVALRLFSKKLCSLSKIFVQSDKVTILEEDLIKLYDEKSESF